MTKAMLLMSAVTVGLPWSNAFAAADVQTLKQGRALATVLPYLMPGVGREAADKAASFWTSKKPGNVEIVESGDQQIVLSFLPESRRLRVDRRQLDRQPSSIVIEPGPMGDMVAHNSQGKILLSAKTERGTVALIGPQGDVIAKVIPGYSDAGPSGGVFSGIRGLFSPATAR